LRVNSKYNPIGFLSFAPIANTYVLDIINQKVERKVTTGLGG